MNNCISVLASYATIILFLFYVVGRIITLFCVKNIWKNEIKMGIDDYSAYDIIDEITTGKNTDDSISGLLISKEGIRDIKVYNGVFDAEKGFIKDKQPIYTRGFLNVGQALAFCVPPGDLFPTLIIECKTFDYLKVNLKWQECLKNGVYSELVCPEHTAQSRMYYLFK